VLFVQNTVGLTLEGIKIVGRGRGVDRIVGHRLHLGPGTFEITGVE